METMVAKLKMSIAFKSIVEENLWCKFVLELNIECYYCSGILTQYWLNFLL